MKKNVCRFNKQSIQMQKSLALKLAQFFLEGEGISRNDCHISVEERHGVIEVHARQHSSCTKRVGHAYVSA